MKIFVVSLKTATERRKSIAKTLQNLGIEFDFIDGVVGSAVDKTNASIVDIKTAGRRMGRPMLDGEIGCALSHANVYAKMIQENIACALVLEDDVIVSTPFADCIKNSDKTLASYDFVMLYHYGGYSLKHLQTVGGLDYHKPAFMPFSTAGYYLNLTTAKLLYDATHPVQHNADWPIALDQHLNTAMITPRIVQHPPLENQTGITGRPTNRLLHRLRMLSGFDYIFNQPSYGTIMAYFRRVYGRFIYKSLSKTIDGL